MERYAFQRQYSTGCLLISIITGLLILFIMYTPTNNRPIKRLCQRHMPVQYFAMQDSYILDSNFWTFRTRYSLVKPLVKIVGLFVRYNKIPVGFICARYRKYLSLEFQYYRLGLNSLKGSALTFVHALVSLISEIGLDRATHGRERQKMKPAKFNRRHIGVTTFAAYCCYRMLEKWGNSVRSAVLLAAVSEEKR